MLYRPISCFLIFLLFLVPLINAQQDYSCSSSKPCKLGCCGKNNVCGLGPNYCSPENCISNCDSKSECDPGWGAQWSQRSKCPLNVCCSKFGFCGTTQEFCGDNKPNIPSCPGGTSANRKIIGYYEGWSTSKACNGLNPENMLSGAYTHLNYAFAFIDPTTYKIANMQDSDTKYMPRLTNLKNYNPGLEVWIAIGGWSMNDPDQPTKRTFSELAASKSKQDIFFASLLSFMDKYGFDGVDIDWEYPVAEERSGVKEDFDNYVTFLRNLRAALGTRGLTITLPASYWYLQHFDIKKMEPIVSWFNVMSYDLHGTWDGANPYLGPYINSHTNLTEIDLALQLLWRNNINPEKVIMGMGFYGRSFTLSDPGCTSAGCGFTAGGNPGRCSASAGTLMFNEIQEVIAKGAKVTTDTKAAVKIVTYDNNQWVSYDDEETLKSKMDYANGKCLGGVMVWAASTDDNKGTAIRALAKAAGKTNLAPQALEARAGSDPSQCTWGECGQSCPAGLIPVESSGSNASPLGIELGCNQGKRNFCCPAKDPPKCNWKGSPKFCGMLAKNRCSDSEIEIAASTDGCWTGHKSLCCSRKDSTSTIGACKWEGAAPFCSAKAFFSSALGPAGGALTFQGYGCSGDRPLEQTKSKQGEGGQQSCSYNGGFKSFCCPDPSPWKNCKWRQGSTSFVQWEYLFTGPLGFIFDFSTDCKTGCEPGETTVATDSWGCRSGTYNYYCCANPNKPTIPTLPETKLCPGPANVPGKSTTLEPGQNQKNILDEGHYFEQTCTFPSSNSKRDLFDVISPNETMADENSIPGMRTRRWNSFTERDLQRRGLRDSVVMKLCGPRQQSSMYVQNYPAVGSVFRSTGKAYTVAKQGVCAAIGVTALTTLDPNVDWVTEHVFEKQEFRDAVEYMMAGKTASGNILTAGAAPSNVFSDTGIFQDSWPSATFPSLTTVRGWAGNINDAFTGLLGRTTDAGANNANYVNLQVSDADFNWYKATTVARDTFISPNFWDQYDPLEQIGVLSDYIDTFKYRAQDAVIKSYQLTYSALLTLWGDFGRYAASQGVNFDFASAFKQIVPDGLRAQQSSARTGFKLFLDKAIDYWNSAAAASTYAPGVVADMKAKLAGFETDIDTLIILPIADMTK